MSAPDRVNPPAHGGLRVGIGLQAGQRRRFGAGARTSIAARVGTSRWSACAWGAIAATATFIAITCWWLTQDRSIPIYDAGDHLETAFQYHSMITAGNLLGPITQESVYPILVHLVGALATFVGGVNVTSPIVGENLVFVPLLALGCYQTGRLLFGRLAGMLAVVFALGSPLLMTMFHVFMLDAPLTALVAVSIWLVLASEDFSRPGVAALAGLAVGVGLNVKSQFAQFLLGLVIVVLLHGGWRNWRGFAIFCAVSLVLGAPWYLVHLSELGTMLEVANTSKGAAPANVPPTLSTANLLWYFWSVLNSQLLAPLYALALGGTLWTLVAVVRGRDRHGARLEFLAGGFLAWLAITLPTHHDIRYGLPLLAFVAVIGSGWIAGLPRAARVGAIALLMLGVFANTLGLSFGVGPNVSLALTTPLPDSQQIPDRILVSSTHGFFLATAPRRDGDVPGLLQALRREGVGTVAWSIEQSNLADFSFEGLLPLSRIAKLSPVVTRSVEYSRSASVATLVHEPVTPRSPPTCTRLSDGTGVWVVRFDAAAGRLAYYCPTRQPQFYDAGAIG